MSDDFATCIRDFVDRALDTGRVLGVLTTTMTAGEPFAARVHDDYLKNNYDSKETREDGQVFYTLKPGAIAGYIKQKAYLDGYKSGRELLPQSLLITLVSQFDAYIGRLVRLMFRSKPELLSGIDRKIEYRKALKFSSLDELRNDLIEKEIESLLRSSYPDQFDTMEKKLGGSLRTDLASWPHFIEVTQRRHLLVHGDGRVSEQYIQMCESNGYSFKERPAIGSQLVVDVEYFGKSLEYICEIGVKLGYVMWCKLLRDQVNDADTALTYTCLNLLAANQFNIALRVLSFRCNLERTFASEHTKAVFKLNLAQAHKWLGETEECVRILDSFEWNHLSDELRLGEKVLREDFESAKQLMIRIGPDVPNIKDNYLAWPIFREFRGTAEFADAFEHLFATPYTIKQEQEDGADPEEQLSQAVEQFKAVMGDILKSQMKPKSDQE